MRSSLYVIALVAVFGASAARAECLAPLISGKWSIRHANGFVVNFDTSLSRNHHFSGSATTRGSSGNLSGAWMLADGSHLTEMGFRPARGTIVVNWQIYWANGSMGKYEGNVDSNGFLQGVTRDLSTRTSSAHFFALNQTLKDNLNC